MSFGFGVGDIMAISTLAANVISAYKDAPNDYKHIAEEVKSLEIVINTAAQHFQHNTTPSNDKWRDCQEILKGCHSVLTDLNSLIEKYNSLAPANKNQAFQRVMLGTEDIATLRARLTSNTTLLSSFIQSCEFLKMQTQLNNLFGLNRTASSVSIDSITSFAGSIDTKNAFKKFCKNLYEIGVRADMIKEKESEILDIFNPRNISEHQSKPHSPAISDKIDDNPTADQRGPQNAALSIQTNNNAITDQRQLPVTRSRFNWIRPPVDFLVGPLMLTAAEEGNTKRLYSSLQFIRDINFEDNLQETALHKGVSRGHWDIVQILLTKGASTEVTNYLGNTPLHIAVQRDKLGIMDLLLNNGASTEATDTGGSTPLHEASFSGKIDAAKLLLDRGASIECRDMGNRTPLHIAADSDDPDDPGVVELLLTNGASTEATDNWGNTPLHEAARCGNTSATKLLLNNGASTDVRNNDKKTPSDLVLGRYPQVAQLLRNKAAELAADHPPRA